MRNKHAETMGLSRDLIPYYHRPYDYTDTEDLDDWWYDDCYEWDYPSYRSLLTATIRSTDRNSVVEVLSQLSIHAKTATLFEDIVVGPFVIVVEAKPLLDRYVLGNILTYRTVSFHISEYEFMKSHYEQLDLNIQEDFRFNMKDWASKFENNVAKNFELEELIDLIRHCKRIERLFTFY